MENATSQGWPRLHDKPQRNSWSEGMECRYAVRITNMGIFILISWIGDSQAVSGTHLLIKPTEPGLW